MTKTKKNKIKPQGQKISSYRTRSQSSLAKKKLQSIKIPSKVKASTQKAISSKIPESPDEEMKDEIKTTRVFFKQEIVTKFQEGIINGSINGSGPAAQSGIAGINIKGNNLKLYTVEDILYFVKRKEENKNEEEKDLIKNIIVFLVKNDICKGSIEDTYLGNSLAKGINRTHNHDIAFISNTSIEETFSLTNIVGFIVVEFGECKSYPFAYSIKLICGSGTGTLLMGLYLYTILSYPDKNEEEKDSAISHIGVLELADAYTNPGGLCMYEKFGFAYDHTMTNPDCFDDVANLPMILKIQEKYNDCNNNIEGIQRCIIDITLGTTTIFDKSRICYVKDTRQVALGVLKNTKIYLEKKKIPTFQKGYYAEKPLYDLLVLYNKRNIINEKNILYILDMMIAFFEYPDPVDFSQHLHLEDLPDDFKKLVTSFASFDKIVDDKIKKNKSKAKKNKNIIADCIVKIFIDVFGKPKNSPRVSYRRVSSYRGSKIKIHPN